MPTNPFLDWNGNTFGITDEALWVFIKNNIANPIPTTRADDFYNDAFQRLRVSDTDQRFDGEFIYDKSPLLFDDISAGGGTTTHNANSRDVTIATGATGTGVSAGLRQHFANPYTPGNSQFTAITGVTNGANIAGGRVIKAGYAAPSAAGVRSSAAKGILDKVPLSVSALGVGDILSLCVIRDTTTNASVGGVINWNEVR